MPLFSSFLGASRRPAFLRFRTNDVLLGTLGVGVRICGVSNSPARMEQLPGWNNYLGSILRLGWNNYLDGTTTQPLPRRVQLKSTRGSPCGDGGP